MGSGETVRARGHSGLLQQFQFPHVPDAVELEAGAGIASNADLSRAQGERLPV